MEHSSILYLLNWCESLICIMLSNARDLQPLLVWVLDIKMNLGGHMGGHPVIEIRVDVSVYKGMGGRLVRSSDKPIDIH